MGGRTAPAIGERLMQEGLSGETPVVISANVSRHNERRWQGTLRDLAAGIAVIGYDDPVLIGIGAAFGVRRVPMVTVQPAPFAAGSLAG